MTARPKPSLHEVSAGTPHGPATLSARLSELRAEWTAGQHRLETIEAERREVRDTLLRIAGAIQVLEELTAREAGAEPAAAPPA